MGSTASVAALKAFGAKRIAVLTPHQPRGDEMVRLYLQEAGLRGGAAQGAQMRNAARYRAGARRRTSATHCKELDGPEIEAVLTVGTALPTAAIATKAEQWLGKPVLAINTVTYWDALRRCGIEDRVFGHGRILEEF